MGMARSIHEDEKCLTILVRTFAEKRLLGRRRHR
jgi:hypothetical protein